MLNIIEEKETISLIPFGDLHLGARNCNLKKIKEVIEIIRTTKNARVIIMGDTVDMGLRDSVGGGTFENDISPQEQLTLAVKLLEPIKNKIYGIHSGNHEQRLTDRTSFDFDQILAERLSIKYLGPSCFHKIRIGNKNIIIYSTHGSSSSTLPHTQMRSVMNLGNFIDADLFLHAHVHSLGWFQDEKFKVDMRSATVRTQTRHYVLTGGFLSYGGYVERKNLKPVRIGSPVIKLSATKDITVRYI